MVYDIDDDVWNFRDGLHQSVYWRDEELLRNVQSCIACADVVTTASPVLANIVEKLNRNVHVLANYVPASLLTMLPQKPVRFTVGYQGGDTHKYDIACVGSELLRFIATHHDTDMAVWGSGQYDGPYPDRVKLFPWEQSVSAYYRSLRMSVGLAPLERIPFNDAKSAIKAVEYAALGIPCIATDSVTYQGTIDPGITGFLVDNYGPSAWYDMLRLLKDNPLLRVGMGQAAWARAAAWTTERNSWRWETVYRG
jgi:glycosyltransferase involved in cell wall biosynthesis